MTAAALARLLVRFRLRSLWNGFSRGPRGPRLGWLLVLLAPAAYVGLFATAFDALRARASLAEQAALLAVVVAAIALASVAGKMAMTEALVGGSGENEFLLARPVPLPTLVVARSLSGAVTDLFDALFLFPVLLAAALAWGLGLPGALAAAGTSIVAQVGLAAAAQAGQLLVVRLVRPARRRLVWALLALAAALTMACVWVLASWVLREPAALVEALRPRLEALRLQPGAALVAPLLALAGGAGWAAALAPVLFAATLLAAAAAVAAVAGRDGWEQAGAPWAEAARGPRPGAPMSPFTKDLLLVMRDRSRLVTLLALPAIFVGVQVFGSAGWAWTAASPRHAAVVAFSLVAYMATFGPLAHMEAERRAFWLLRSVPVPLGRLLAWKAVFWSAVLGATAALTFAGLLLAASAPATGEALTLGLLVTGGAVGISWLAVGMASGAADLSSPDRRAISLGTVYLFLFVGGLYNLVLLGDAALRARALVLYAAVVGLHWLTGVEAAAAALDPPARRARRLVAADGAQLAILLFLGARAQQLVARVAAGPGEARWGEAVWIGVVAVAALVYLWRRRAEAARGGAFGALGIGLLAGAAGAALGRLDPGPLDLAVAIPRALAEELALRGVVQRALDRRWRTRPAGRWAAAGVAAALALAAGAQPAGPGALAAATLPAVALAASGRLGAALAARLVIELAPALGG